jgi:hypothetical protein
LLVRLSHVLQGIRVFDQKLTVRAFVVWWWRCPGWRGLRPLLSMDKGEDEQKENESPRTWELETPITVATDMAWITIDIVPVRYQVFSAHCRDCW